jgi:CheY-like chemotaxis protein
MRIPSLLIVDDEPSNLKYAERVLRDTGYRITVASNGAEALSIANAQGPFDLFVIDVMMPEMRGDELAQRLRDTDPNVKVLFFTAYSDRLFEGEALAPQDAFLDKPANIKGLREAVSLALFGHMHGPATSG